MRSRDNLERVLRLASVILAAWMVWASLSPFPSAPAHRWSNARSLADSLAAWTWDPRAESLHVALPEAPVGSARAWLEAFRRAGARVQWSSAIPASAIALERVNDPAGGWRALVAAPPGARVVVADALGVLDTLVMRAPAAEVRSAVVRPPVRARLGRQEARAVAPDTLERRSVLVLGSAGWESKFVIAALEERGWAVAARLRVAPRIDVTQGAPVIDTARVGVVIALDTTAAAQAPRLARFVRAGGGLVLAGSAARSGRLAALAPGTAGARVPATSLAFTGTPRRALGFFPVMRLARDAVVLERQGNHVAAAAWRVGAGRVVQVGYDETWRWRLAGDDDAPDAHRAWWSAIVSSAAYRAAHPVAAGDTAMDAAPLVATVAALGSPISSAAGLSSGRAALPRARELRLWMLVLLFALLLGEWTSRRLRGVS
jgi:hypothetical protein